MLHGLCRQGQPCHSGCGIRAGGHTTTTLLSKLIDQQLHVFSLEVQRGQALAAVRDLHAVLRMVIRRDMDLHGSADGVVLEGDDLKR